MSPIRLGIVGCGAVTERYHLPAVAASQEVELAALVDPRLDRASQLAAGFGSPLVAGDHAALAGTVEAAIVAVPNHLHAVVAADLARAGIHVLVEKPLARTGAECDAIEAAARSSGVVAAVGHDFRHFPLARVARGVLGEELLGPLRSVDLRQSAGGRWPYVSTYVYSRAESGGGVLIDFGVHMLDLLCWWLGPLTVEAWRDDAAGGVETEGELELRTGAGVPVTFSITRLRDQRDTTLAAGEKGTLEVGIFEPAVLRLVLAGAPAIAGGAPDPEFEAAPLRTVFGRQLDDFVRAIRTGSTPLVPLSEGRLPVEIVERAYALRTPLRRPWDWPEPLAEPGGSDMSSALAGRRVLVTGASGFVGERTVERLVVEHGATVRIAVRSVARAAVLSRFPVEIAVANLLDRASLDRAVEGCDLVVNCAKAVDGDPGERHSTETDGVRNLLEAAAGARVKRLVHTSTYVVRDIPPSGFVDESTPYGGPPDPYADAKRDGERIALGYQGRLEVVVIEPTVVYGPRAGVYGRDILAELSTSRIPLIAGGRGICNALYVDDLVTALLLAATSPRAAGETFLVSGSEHPTWAEFFGAFERMLGLERTVALTEDEALRHWRSSSRPRWLVPEALRVVRRDAELRRRLLDTREGAVVRALAGRILPARVFEPERWLPTPETGPAEPPLAAFKPQLIRFLAGTARARIDKARELLGYEPAVGLEEGMRLTELWARWEGLVPERTGP